MILPVHVRSFNWTVRVGEYLDAGLFNSSSFRFLADALQMPFSAARVPRWPNQERREEYCRLIENRIVSLCNQALEEQTWFTLEQRQGEYEAILEEPGA